MKHKRIFEITFCAIMAAMAIALNSVASLQVTQAIKITVYALPLLVVGVLFGPLMGLTTGLVAGVVLQLTSPYGISLSSPFWALAPSCWGGVSGLMYKLFKKLGNWPAIIIAIVLASISANLVNTLAMIMDSLLVKDSWYTFSAIMLDWPGRLLTMVVTLIPYIAITGIVCESLRKIFMLDENSDTNLKNVDSEGKEEKEEIEE